MSGLETRLLGMAQSELDGVFLASPSGPIPDGQANGTAIILPGSPINGVFAELAWLLAWRGKTFYRQNGILTNRLTPFELPSVVAFVYEGASMFDGRPCIVLDYSRTSIVARYIRDEIRLVEPGLYLGRVYVMSRYMFGFALRFFTAS